MIQTESTHLKQQNTAGGGPDVPLFLAEDHVGSQHDLLKWTCSANHKQDPTEPLPTSLKSPKGWRGFGATERTGEFTLQLFLRFPILLHHLLTNPKDPQGVWRGQHIGSREDGLEEKTLPFLPSGSDSIKPFSIAPPLKKKKKNLLSLCMIKTFLTFSVSSNNLAKSY